MSECITSLSSAHVKDVKKLLEKSKARREEKAFVCDGVRAVSEIPAKLIKRVYYVEKCDALAKEISMKSDFHGAIYQVSEQVMNAMSDTKTPQGIMAVVGFPFDELMVSQEDAFLEEGTYVFLENLQDPGNLGTIIRTAQGAGVKAVIMSSDCVDIYSPKVVRSTMSSLFKVRHIIVSDFHQSMESAKVAGVKLYAAALGGKRTFWDVDFKESKSVGFLIGNEGNGLTEKTVSMSDEPIIIPMENGLESLNASMAAGVLMYEAARQRRS